MAAPVAAFVQLPTDSGNSGKKVRTQSRVVGSDTVHEHFFIPVSRQRLLGIHKFGSTVFSVQAAAQNGTTTGHLWFHIPVGSSVRARLRYLDITYYIGAAAAADHFTVPRTILQRFTFTGTASGATLPSVLRRSDDAAAVGTMRTASTGMTVTLVGTNAGAVVSVPPTIDFTAAAGITIIPAVITTSRDPDHEDEYTDIAAGEGLVLWQVDAGTTSDVRRLLVNAVWDEYDNA